MTQTAIVSLQALKAVALAASTEETRYYLRGVFLTVEPRRSIYVATNGHVLMCHAEELGKDDPDNTLTGAWIVPSDAIAKLKLRKGDVPATLWAGEGQAKGQLCITHARTGDVTMFAPVDGTFPDWRRVCPRAIEKGDTVERVHFNPALIGLFGEVATKRERNPAGVFLHTRAVNEPAAVTFGYDTQTFGVVMPMRAGEQLGNWAGLPVWAGGTPLAAEEPAPVAQAA